MRRISLRTKKFEKSFTKLYRAGKLNQEIISDIEKIIDLLSDNVVLPEKFKDHSLKGRFKSYRECHVRPDILIVYEISKYKPVVVLINTGSHSQLFK